METRVVSGIQQVGIGVEDADAAYAWYKNIFGFDIQVFADAAEANLMQRYTGGMPHKRYAILALNLQGGGGLEIWQYTSRKPQPANEPFAWGRPGIMGIKLRCKDVDAFYAEVKAKGVELLTTVAKNPVGKKHFYLKDPYGNIFEPIEDDYWFTTDGRLTGGICGVSIAVSGMAGAIDFYEQVLGMGTVYNRTEAPIKDWEGLGESNTTYHRVILTSNPGAQPGAFGRLLGPYQIELIQSFPAIKGHIFENRYWGDLGFIHLCFDIKGYDKHIEICEKAGYPLTVDSGAFAMGAAAGRFSYNEDPDGSLLEYVETFKVPILKKLGWYMNLTNRPPAKHLPDWMVKAMRFNRK